MHRLFFLFGMKMDGMRLDGYEKWMVFSQKIQISIGLKETTRVNKAGFFYLKCK